MVKVKKYISGLIIWPGKHREWRRTPLSRSDIQWTEMNSLACRAWDYVLGEFEFQVAIRHVLLQLASSWVFREVTVKCERDLFIFWKVVLFAVCSHFPWSHVRAPLSQLPAFYHGTLLLAGNPRFRGPRKQSSGSLLPSPPLPLPPKHTVRKYNTMTVHRLFKIQRMPTKRQLSSLRFSLLFFYINHTVLCDVTCHTRWCVLLRRLRKRVRQ